MLIALNETYLIAVAIPGNLLSKTPFGGTYYVFDAIKVTYYNLVNKKKGMSCNFVNEKRECIITL